MVVTFHGQASGALSGCCAEPRLRPCRRWRTTPQLRLFPRPARPPSPRQPRGRGRRSVVRTARTPPPVRAPRRGVVRAAGLCGSAVPLGGVECAMRVPLGGVEWCDISWQLRICWLLCHSVALSARCACHSVASSGAPVIQRGSGAIKEVDGTGGQHRAAKGNWPTREK